MYNCDVGKLHKIIDIETGDFYLMEIDFDNMSNRDMIRLCERYNSNGKVIKKV